MLVKIHGAPDMLAYKAAKEVVERLGFTTSNGAAEGSFIAVAPLLTRILPEDELNAPALGTLIFHPSPLPYGRGASAIKWAYKRGEPITAATWFWADKGIDTGDICEQEVICIDYSLRPREFYERDVIPTMARTLERALIGISMGIIRRVPQMDKYATYDKML